jgi:hypothetical protein
VKISENYERAVRQNNKVGAIDATECGGRSKRARRLLLLVKIRLSQKIINGVKFAKISFLEGIRDFILH